MKKHTIIIGDIHGRSIWKDIIKKENPDRIIFIGDYFDSFDILGPQQSKNFQEIIDYKENTDKEVILLIGNHDYQYTPSATEEYSGHQGAVGKIIINHLLQGSKDHLQMAYQFDNILCTHAGVTEEFLLRSGWDDTTPITDHLNELWKYTPKVFEFGYYIPDTEYKQENGDDIRQSPIWVRPRSLMKNAQRFKQDIIQVVGHTAQNQIDIKGKATGGRYYFIDTLGTSGEYLIVKDGLITSNKLDLE